MCPACKGDLVCGPDMLPKPCDRDPKSIQSATFNYLLSAKVTKLQQTFGSDEKMWINIINFDSTHVYTMMYMKQLPSCSSANVIVEHSRCIFYLVCVFRDVTLMCFCGCFFRSSVAQLYFRQDRWACQQTVCSLPTSTLCRRPQVAWTSSLEMSCSWACPLKCWLT